MFRNIFFGREDLVIFFAYFDLEIDRYSIRYRFIILKNPSLTTLVTARLSRERIPSSLTKDDRDGANGVPARLSSCLEKVPGRDFLGGVCKGSHISLPFYVAKLEEIERVSNPSPVSGTENSYDFIR